MPSIYSKNSFDRIDDDLCEVILSYFSLEDKFRYECVSKQFKRCIYQKQNQLKINYKLANKMKRTDLLGNKLIDLQLFESILIKCQFINQIFIETMDNHSESNYKQMIEMIINYCQYLSAIDLYFGEPYEEVFEKFFTKFGPKLKKIGFNRNSDLNKSNLILCKNIRELNIKRLNSGELSQLFFEDNDISLKRLNKIQMKCSNIESNGFNAFVNKCKNSLESIDLDIYTVDKNNVFNIFNQLKECRNLKSLRISFNSEVYVDYSIVTQLKLIAENCIHLKHFSLKTRTQNLLNNLEIFNSMKNFKQLKKFEFKFGYAMKVLKTGNHFTCGSLKDCQHLTHLTMSGSKLFDVFFKDISLHLPKLQYLVVSNARLTEQSFEELSKLKDLRNLDLFLHEIYSIGLIDKVIKNCKKIRSINLSSHRINVVLDEMKIKEVKQDSHSLHRYLKINTN